MVYKILNLLLLLVLEYNLNGIKTNELSILFNIHDFSSLSCFQLLSCNKKLKQKLKEMNDFKDDCCFYLFYLYCFYLGFPTSSSGNISKYILASLSL